MVDSEPVKVSTGPYKRLRIDRVVPNGWNPNVMLSEQYQKLKTGLRRTLKESGEIPPIVVRRLKGEKKSYEIIDGFHRWKALSELGEKKISVFVLKVSDSTARILTRTLNYLRGSPDRAKYARGLVELIELGVPMSDLRDILPESDDDLDMLLDESNITITAFEKLSKQEESSEFFDADSKPHSDEDVWVDLKFRVSVGQARVIEQELKRLGTHLGGKNARARALEYMAVNSSQTDLSECV